MAQLLARLTGPGYKTVAMADDYMGNRENIIVFTVHQHEEAMI